MSEMKVGVLERDSVRKVALVTGGSRGIGRETALGLAADGLDIALVYAGNEQAAATTVADIETCGAVAHAYQCDVADSASVNKVVKQILDDFGHVWALVNNAGITRDGLIARMSDEDFDRVVDVNLRGAFHVIRALSRTFMRQRGGRIVNVSSVVGLMGNAGQANYASSKAGVVGLTKSVARELSSRGVTCNAVAPGFIETDMTRALPDAVCEGYSSQIPLGRLGTAQEVAHVIQFLISDAARYITGEVIRVDGGMDM